jgi:hypothetical protein
VKQLPVEADVPEFLVKRGLAPDARKLDHAIGDLTMIAFYYLLCIGKYTTKGARNNSKQTEEFKLGNITFFSKDTCGQLRCLLRDAPAELVLAAKSATRKLDNQKNSVSIRNVMETRSTAQSVLLDAGACTYDSLHHKSNYSLRVLPRRPTR